MPIQFQNDWIPVHVALPEDGQEVFFAREGSVFRGQFWLKEQPHFASPNMRYWLKTERVTHWMPSPTPAPPSGVVTIVGP